MECNIEENEEIRGINDKKAFEDQLTTLIVLWWNCFSILSLSHTLVHLEKNLRELLEHAWSTLFFIIFG